MCSFSHREKPVFITWEPCNKYRYFAVWIAVQVESIRVENVLQPCIGEVPFGASVTAFNTFEEMSNNTASIKALLQQMIIETSLMLAQPLCNETIVSLMANQGEGPAAAFNNLPGRHSDHFCIKLSKNMFVLCVCLTWCSGIETSLMLA